MESEQGRPIPKSHEKMFQIFSNFMERTAKFEELVAIGSSLLAGFQQGLDFVRRPPVEKSSKLVNQIIKANETKRLSSYIDAGCVKVHDSLQNISKWKEILEELELFLRNAEAAVQAVTDNLYSLELKDIDQDQTASFHNKYDATDYATMMAIIYSMVRKDYDMQEKIVSSLSLKSSSGELESYCMMWSLRPFVDDEIMHKAWKLIP